MVTGYQVLARPGAQSFAGTFGTAMYWASGIAMFKPADRAAVADEDPGLSCRRPAGDGRVGGRYHPE